MAFLDILLIVVLIAVVGVLIFGLISMARGGEASRKYSNKMMRWRVILQFVAVAVVIAILFFREG
jgi:NADH:ubiquinone oxidoreductase subunit 6 (subunit J)